MAFGILYDTGTERVKAVRRGGANIQTGAGVLRIDKSNLDASGLLNFLDADRKLNVPANTLGCDGTTVYDKGAPTLPKLYEITRSLTVGARTFVLTRIRNSADGNTIANITAQTVTNIKAAFAQADAADGFTTEVNRYQ